MLASLARLNKTEKANKTELQAGSPLPGQSYFSSEQERKEILPPKTRTKELKNYIQSSRSSLRCG